MLLGKEGVDVTQAEDDGETPLCIASQKGYAEVVSLLLGKEGVDVNQARNDGVTPLFRASQEGHAEVVSLLLGKEGVAVNQARNDGITPLIAACRQSCVAVAKLLLLNGSIYVGPTMGAIRGEMTEFAYSVINDHTAMIIFRLCVWRAHRTHYHTLHRMSRYGSVTLRLIEDFLVPRAPVTRRAFANLLRIG